jgi:hypothetical protein
LKRVYIGFRSSLAVLSVADKGHPSLLGWMDLDGEQLSSILVPTLGTPTILVGTRGGRVGWVDVSIPSAMAWIGTPASQDVRGMALTSTSLLLASSSNLVLLDPSSLAVQSTTALGSPAYAATALGNIAYVCTDFGLHLFDISIPAMPVALSSIASAKARALAIQDRSGSLYAFVANNGGAPDLSIFDVTAPTAPVPLATPDLSSGGGTALALSGNTLFLAGTSGGLQVVDVANPALPVLSTAYSASEAWGVALDGNDIFVHGRKGGLIILDGTALPSPPPLYGDFPSPGAWGIDIQGRFGYFGGPGFFVVDLATLPRPRVVGRLTSIGATGIQVVGATAYVADQAGFLRVVDVSVPTAPALSASFPLPGTPRALRVREGYALVACDDAGLVVVRLSDGVIFTFPTSYWAEDIHLSGNLAFVATYWSDGVNPSVGGVEVVDVSNPQAPASLATAVALTGVNGLKVVGKYLYAATDWGMEVFDVSVPSTPYFIGGIPTSVSALGVSVADGLAYLAAYDQVKILDVSSPWSPVEVGSYPTEPWASNPLYYDGYCYVASALAGVYVLHYVNACYDRYEPNDDFALGWPIETGTYYDGLICNGSDQDFYALSLPSGGTITASMTPPSGRNYDLFLFDATHVLVASSIQGAGSVENLSFTANAPASYTLLVNGSDPTQFSSSQTYRLVFSFTPCQGPSQPLVIYSARLDPNGNAILDILDPNQPATVTGYNIYRAGTPTGPWALRAGNVVDMDHGTANTQFIDAGSNSGGPYFYLVTAVNATCGAEGP